MKNYFFAIFFLLVSFFASPVYSKDEPLLEKVGEATLKWMFSSIYTSQLFSTSKPFSYDNDGTLLAITYHKNISSERLLKQTGKEWRRLGLEREKYEKWIKDLTTIFPNVKKGDTLQFKYENSGLNQFIFNGIIIGSVSDPEFGEAFLDIWLHPDNRYPVLRSRLLGHNYKI